MENNKEVQTRLETINLLLNRLDKSSNLNRRTGCPATPSLKRDASNRVNEFNISPGRVHTCSNRGMSLTSSQAISSRPSKRGYLNLTMIERTQYVFNRGPPYSLVRGIPKRNYLADPE